MPNIPAKIQEQLGITDDDSLSTWDSIKKWGKLPAGLKVYRKEIIFPRIEGDRLDQAPTQKSQKTEGLKQEMKTEIKEEGVSLISIEDFAKVKLRVAEVLEAEKVKGTDKLLKLQIEIGDEKRQIVAGIAKHYAPEELVGKKIVVVANLKPAKLRGIESQGMLLAASDEKNLTLITVDRDIKSGVKVK
jgi:methionyl-tRNA synthetase